MILALALAALALVPQDAANDKRRLTSAPDRRVELDFQHYYKTRELRNALSSLAAAYPEFLQMESLGRSRGGEDLWMVRLGDNGGPDPETRPAIFVAASQSLSDVQGTELALASLVEFLQNHAREERITRALRETTMYFLPCANPDLRTSVLAALESGTASSQDWPARIDLERNYPVGWSPFGGDLPGHAGNPGPYPLSEAEARFVSTFLVEHENVGVVVAFAPLDAAGPAGAWGLLDQPNFEEPTSLRQLLDVQVQQAGARVEFSGRIVDPRGNLDDFAFGQLGALPLRILCGEIDVQTGLALPRTEEIGPHSRRVAASLLALSEALPRLAIAGTSVQRLKNDLWQLEITIANTGSLRTQSVLGSARRAVGLPRLLVRGGKLAGGGLRAGREDVYQPLDEDEGQFTLIELDGGAQVRVRVLLAAPQETAVELVASAPRAGTATTSLVLR